MTVKRFYSIEEYRSWHSAQGITRPPSAVALGKFDGIHIGHQKLINCITREAAASGLTSIVLVLSQGTAQILNSVERAAFLESLGVDVLIECMMTRDLMGMTPDAFVHTALKGRLNAVFIAAGEDCRFGYQRAGDAAMLMSMQSIHSYRAQIIDKVCLDGEAVSSTRVREALERSDMPLAEKLLGQPYFISGKVRHGHNLGTGIGLPTVNLLPTADKLLPPDGVYVTQTELEDGRTVRGLTNVGTRPTVGGSTRTVETTLLDFHEDLYEKYIRVDFERFLRGEIRFPSLEALKAQVEKDMEAAGLRS